MDNQTSVSTNPETALSTRPTTSPIFDDHLAIAGKIANTSRGHNTFQGYQAELSRHTIHRQHNDLTLFSRYLAAAGIQRSAPDLYTYPQAWHGMTHGLLLGFREWLGQQGHKNSSIAVTLSTIRKYCILAGPQPDGAGIIEEETLTAILTVKGRNGKKGRHYDEERRQRGIPTQIGRKKADPTPLTSNQTLQLKKTTVTPAHKPLRKRDALLKARDQLMMGLLLEHALRAEEVTLLDIQHLNLQSGLIAIYAPKTDKADTQRMKKHTRLAAEQYLTELRQQGITSGPLFPGYKGQRMTTRGINKRVGQIGKELGIETLSPHDGRHEWAIDALRNGTSIDRVQAGGRWASPHMVLHYAKITGISNEGVKITEEEDTPLS